MEQRNRKPYSEWHFICFPQPGGGGGGCFRSPSLHLQNLSRNGHQTFTSKNRRIFYKNLDLSIKGCIRSKNWNKKKASVVD